MGVRDDYRVLLADGVVPHPGLSRRPRRWPKDADAWAVELRAMAEADGLRADYWCKQLGDNFGEPHVALFVKSGPSSRVSAPYDHAIEAAWWRPRAEEEWGERIQIARRKAGLSILSDRLRRS